jgi:hypothetical protein
MQLLVSHSWLLVQEHLGVAALDVWNLWVRDQRTGESHRIADVPCNEIQPAWESERRVEERRHIRE